MLELKDASLTRDGKTLFSHLSMMALDGHLTCITGPRSSGKTALIRVLLGFVAPDEGLVSINGELLTPLSAATFRRMMVYLPQASPTPPLQLERGGSLTHDPSPIGEGGSQREVESISHGSLYLESVWCGAEGDGWPCSETSVSTTAPTVDSHLPATAAIVIADDPSLALMDPLRRLCANGSAVVVATCRKEYLDVADKIIDLGKP